MASAHNLADALERFAVRALASLRKELQAEESAGGAPPSELPPPATTTALSPRRLPARNEQRHAEIHELMAHGLTITVIARRVRLDRKTVRRFASAGAAADLLGPHGRRATELDPHLPYLATRWLAGQHVAALLFDEIRQQGYRGSKRTVRRQLAGWRTAEPPPPAHALLRGPRTLAWLLLRCPSDLDDKEQLLLKQLCERTAELGSARRLPDGRGRVINPPTYRPLGSRWYGVGTESAARSRPSSP